MGGRLEVERVEALAELKTEWDALAERAAGIFTTWEWADAWWQTYGQGHELLLHAGRDSSGALVTVVPLYTWRTRPRVLRFLGHGPGDELGPVFAPGDERRAADALRAALASLDWHVVLAEQLPGDTDWPALLGGARWRREAAPVLTSPTGGWEEWLAGRSVNFRQQHHRRLRALERAGAVTFRLADAATLEGDLDTLFELHRRRFAGQRSDFRDTHFHREVARRALCRGWLRLWLLELDGRPVAAWHGFHAGGVTSYYQAGRDPAYDAFGVGGVLLGWSIQAAMAEGATAYRFGRGAEEYKRRYADMDPGLLTISLERGMLGGITVSAAHLARRLRRTLR